MDSVLGPAKWCAQCIRPLDDSPGDEFCSETPHAIEHFYTTPRLIVDSAEPGSGKTRVLDVAQYLYGNPR